MPAVEPAVPEVDLLAASLRADLADLDVFVEVLADKLTAAIPGAVEVVRAGGGRFRRSRPRVESVEVTLGDRRLRLARTPGGLRTEVVHEVRGIRLSGEDVPPEAWVQALATGLAEQAGRSAAARDAVQRLLG
jgi:hypothetical protein